MACLPGAVVQHTHAMHWSTELVTHFLLPTPVSTNRLHAIRASLSTHLQLTDGTHT